MYPKINDNAKNANYTRAVHHFIYNQTQKYNYVIDKKVKNYNNYNQYFKLTGQATDYLTNQKNSFMKDFQSYEFELGKEENIYYYALDAKTKKSISNTSDPIEDIQINKDLQKKYKYYFQIIFNEKGRPSIQFVDENLEKDLASYTNNIYLDAYHDIDDEGPTESELSIITPKNIVITYAIPEKIIITDAINEYMNISYKDQILLFMLPYVAISTFVVIITFLLIPFHKIKNNRFFHFISEIKLEILSTLWILSMYVLIYVLFALISLTMSNDIQKFYEFFAIEYMAPYLTTFANIGLWSIFFLLIAIFIYMIKYLFNKGIKAYFIENTCICWIYRTCKNWILGMMCFDFDNNINRILFKILSLNLLIMIVLCFIFAINPIIAITYTLILFIVLKKKFEDIQKDYHVLLKSTQQLSNGHFDFEINEDIGMFNPLKNEFSHIKEGFEKAVNEEVKAQKTKTELISNVSHDLKTPLTSIITYVDLLKNKNLTEQQRDEYVQILERNSLRLKNLIEDLFEVSKANSGDVKLDIVDVDIISMLKQVELEYHDQFNVKNLNIRLQYSHDKIICALDSSKTYRIFENLFINVSKYALENTRVYIDVEDKDEYVEIVFKNISKDEMTFSENDIVERFVQGDKSRNTSGSGLGLAIVKSFTELQGGSFFVQLDGDLFKTTLRFNK